jgi:hypothetical protein
MPHYVTVPAQAIEDFCEAKGFTRTTQRNEVVYVRASRRNPDVKIKVYTSIRAGRSTARGNGKDSIKVCAVFDNGRKSFGIGRFPRVHRTGSTEAVLARVLERLMAAAARANEWIGQNDGAWRERLADKDAFARQERAQEERAFASGP